MNEGALREFIERRETGNRKILAEPNLTIRRFVALDGDAYADGTLSRREKELQGLAASVVLRCDDCIRYHLMEALECGAKRAEIVETLAVALVVGGSVVIPHLRQAFSFLDFAGATGEEGREDAACGAERDCRNEGTR